MDGRRGRARTPSAEAPSNTGGPPGGERLAEQINPTSFSGPVTQEDWYWGRLAAGQEEDYYWRRLSDNWYQKDVIPSTYLEIHNQCYEAYNANPLANYVVEITTNFVLGTGLTIAATNRRVQKVLDRFCKNSTLPILWRCGPGALSHAAGQSHFSAPL